jgi:small subunit ribosomal protein S20
MALKLASFEAEKLPINQRFHCFVIKRNLNLRIFKVVFYPKKIMTRINAMANHKSALKRIRQTAKRTERNRFYRTRLKNIVKAVRTAIDAGNKEEAAAALKTANQQIHKFVSKGILKKETAARKVSRLHQAVNAL